MRLANARVTYPHSPSMSTGMGDLSSAGDASWVVVPTGNVDSRQKADTPLRGTSQTTLPAEALTSLTKECLHCA